MPEESLKQKLKRTEQAYSEELERKDKLIEELKENNKIIMKSALKQSKQIDELTTKLTEALKQKK